jgi:hypothetical protein
MNPESPHGSRACATSDVARTFFVREGGGFSYPPAQLRRDKSRVPSRVADPCYVGTKKPPGYPGGFSRDHSSDQTGELGFTAITSISTDAPAGSLATWNVLRAGQFSVKWRM